MRKNLMKVAVLAGLGLVGQLAATDFRAPIATQMGPLHYSFDKLHKKKSNFTYFATAHFRETEDAFMKHGTETHPLAQLIFGQESFTISQAFENEQTWEFGLTQNHSPYLKTTKLAPRVSYSEAGVFFGASWDYPVWNNKGRIGIRGSLPIRWVRMERDTDAEANALGVQADVIKQETRYVDQFDGSTPAKVSNIVQDVSSYRLALLRGLLKRDKDGYVVAAYQPIVQGGHNKVTIGSANYGIANAADYANTDAGASVPFVVIQAKNSGQPPYNQGGSLLVGKINTDADAGKPVDVLGGTSRVLYPQNRLDNTTATVASFDAYRLVALTTDGSGPVAGDCNLVGAKAAAFVVDTDYTKLDLDSAAGQNLWVTTINGMNTKPENAVTKLAVENIDNLLLNYQNSANVEQWLADRGFVIATDEQTGLGDIPAEIFYEIGRAHV